MDPDRILEEIRSARFKQMPIEALAGAGLITVEQAKPGGEHHPAASGLGDAQVIVVAVEQTKQTVLAADADHLVLFAPK